MSKKNKNNSLTKQGVRNLGFSPKSKVNHLLDQCEHPNMELCISQPCDGMSCPDCGLVLDIDNGVCY